MKLAITKDEHELILNALKHIKDEKSEDAAFDEIFKRGCDLYEKTCQNNFSGLEELEISKEDGKTILFALYLSAPEKILPTSKLAKLIFMLIYEIRLKP